MKKFWGFVIKEFYHIFRDKRTMLVLFGMPLIMMLLFGFVITNEIKDAKIAVWDLSNDPTTKGITSKIASSGYFQVVEVLTSGNEVESIFKKGNVKEVIVFEKDFEKKLYRTGVANVQLFTDASDANQAKIIADYTAGIIRIYGKSLNRELITPYRIETETRMFYNPELKGVYMFVPGIMAMILMLVSALMTSISIVREKEMGTMEVLLVSPLRPIQIILGKVMPYVFLSFINAGLIIVLSLTVFDLPVQGSILLLLTECLLFIVLALSLGILISASTSNQQVAMLLSMVALMLPTMLLSGFIYPVENMPWILQVLCHLMPPKWFIEIVKGIMLKGVGLEKLWFETMILMAMTFALLAISVRKFKKD
ncbi:MAG: ABC transporter permease [Bacteroidetes bacterium]|nr:ABC transporter permease [Bacteroidota bacterium]